MAVKRHVMGPTRGNGLARIADNPYKADHLRPYTERKSVKGVPAKWRPVYDELCKRMFERQPGALDFSWEGSTLITRPFDYIGPRDEGWTEYDTPEAACEALGIASLVKAAKATQPKAKPKGRKGEGLTVRERIAGGDHVPNIVDDGSKGEPPWVVARMAEAKASECPAPPAAPVTPSSDGWPGWADEYLNRLVYPPKRDYAVKWLEHVLEGTSPPADPGHEWAHKVRARVAKLAKTA